MKKEAKWEITGEWDAVFTVEASFIMPVVMGVLLFFLFTCLELHDLAVLYAESAENSISFSKPIQGEKLPEKQMTSGTLFPAVTNRAWTMEEKKPVFQEIHPSEIIWFSSALNRTKRGKNDEDSLSMGTK